MVDVDRRPDPRSLWSRLIAGFLSRASRLTSLTRSRHQQDAATTANYLHGDDQEAT